MLALTQATESFKGSRLSAWVTEHATVIATATLVIATIGAATGSAAVLWIGVTEHSKRVHDAEVRIAACENGNRARYGGADYSRGLIRDGWRRQGFDDLADAYPDIPAIDCLTGKLVPLPKGAQK